MRARALLCAALLAGLCSSGSSARADDPPRSGDGPTLEKPSAYFPTELGRRWTYSLKVTVGKDSRTIEYTTKVARAEKLEGVGECVVLESHSDRLLSTEWFQVDDRVGVVNVKRQEGKAAAELKGRVLISPAALTALARNEKPAPVEWKSKAGNAQGTLTVVGLEKIRLRNYGQLECLVVVDKGTYTFGEGKVVRVQERRLYFAPELGLVKEVMQVKKPDGTVTMETLAELKHHET
ncbi:MAG: hypothetical protein AB7N76_32120 [Planctomycetota bacterium]